MKTICFDASFYLTLFVREMIKSSELFSSMIIVIHNSIYYKFVVRTINKNLKVKNAFVKWYDSVLKFNGILKFTHHLRALISYIYLRPGQRPARGPQTARQAP